MIKSLKTILFIVLSIFTLSNTQGQNLSINDFIVEGLSDGSLIIKSGNISGSVDFVINGEDEVVIFNNGNGNINVDFDESGKLLFLKSKGETKVQKLYHVAKLKNGSTRSRKIPLWLSLIPPLIAIILALIFKEVIVSLFVGIWAGAFIAGGLRIESIYYFIQSFFKVIEKYVIGALNDSGHLSVIVFSLLIGGMVAIISKNGGMAGVVKSLSKYARSERSTQFITWLLGVAIFFDDYANTLIVGNTMRSLTDKFKISREKLAYIVDSTAAPVSAIAFITTWIGAELGFIDGGLALLENYNGPATPYAVFLASLKYAFYPVLTLIFILIIIYTKKDYGPMLKAEHRSRTTGQVSPATSSEDDEPNMEDLSPVKGATLKWYNAVIPVATVIFMTIFGLVDTGMAASYGQLSEAGISTTSGWGDIWSKLGGLTNGNGFFMKLGTLIGNADSYVALLWASLSGVVMAIILTISGKIMSLFDTMHWMVNGFKTMLPALIILTLAWALAIITSDLHTADFITSALEGNIPPYFMPTIIFVLAALIAFSTGSSWSTMAILYPIAIPSTWAICVAAGISPEHSLEILLNVISTVLAASVLGDHCSPISDTTILSSLASDCNHIDHVKTQMPYALTVGFVAIICNTLSTFFGGGWLLSMLLVAVSVGALYVFVNKKGSIAASDSEIM